MWGKSSRGSDRLPLTRGLWRLVILISLGGAFEFYDLFMTAYVAPGSGGERACSRRVRAGFFAIDGVGFFVFCTFAGMWLGAVGFGFIADRLGRRSIFTVSLLWYSLATAMMAFQHSAAAHRSVALHRRHRRGAGADHHRYAACLNWCRRRGAAGSSPSTRASSSPSVPLVALLGWLLLPLHPFGLDGWRWVALIGASGALLAWWFRLAVPESPRWLALHGQGQASRRDFAQNGGARGKRSGPRLCPLPLPRRQVEEKGRFRELFEPPYLTHIGDVGVQRDADHRLLWFRLVGCPLSDRQGHPCTTSLQYAFIIALANPVGPFLAYVVADRIERKWQIVAAGAITASVSTCSRARTCRRW